MDHSQELSSFTPTESSFAQEVEIGLRKPRKKISSKYLYDTRGSELFCKIMTLPEYYPTDAEKEIFQKQAADFFAGHLAEKFQIVELGAGDGIKTEILLSDLLERGHEFRYVPVDICPDSVNELTQKLADRLPALQVEGAVADYTHFFKTKNVSKEVQNIVLFLGSNIGNFTTQESLAFLSGIRENLQSQDLLLVGFDLKKDIEVLTKAYNDSEGVTAAFNLNLLHRMNRELGSNIDVNTFTHYGFYNPFSGAMESCLISTVEQDIKIPALSTSVHFNEYEPIHLEYSFKYTLAEVEDFARLSGFECLHHFKDSQNLFVDSIWRPLPLQ